MNNIRAIEALNQRELDAAIPPSASWHTDWDDTAYIYIGGLPYELSEGDIITIFSQYGEPVHVNLIRDKDTGKSKGFAFLKYEDQRSTTLAVDNLGGTNILGRTIRVDHTRYKSKEGDGSEEVGLPSLNEDDDADNGSRRKKRREEERSPTPELLPEEIELRRLIMEHDDDDPMKEYLVKEKKEEVQKALERRNKEKKSRHRRDDQKDERKHRHRSHRHRSRSTDKRSRRDRSRSQERRPEGHRSERGVRDRHRDSRRHREDDRRHRRDSEGYEERRGSVEKRADDRARRYRSESRYSNKMCLEQQENISITMLRKRRILQRNRASSAEHAT